MISGFLLCLKIFHPRRIEFIKDFNEALKTIVFSGQPTPLIVFTLSDSQERVPTFIGKILSKEIMAQKGSSVFVFNLNAPTERSIDKMLKTVAEGEQLCLADQQLLEIRNQCNKDLRNAIITLQFLAAGKSLEELPVQGKRKKGNTSRKMTVIEEEEEFMSSQRTKND